MTAIHYRREFTRVDESQHLLLTLGSDCLDSFRLVKATVVSNILACFSRYTFKIGQTEGVLKEFWRGFCVSFFTMYYVYK